MIVRICPKCGRVFSCKIMRKDRDCFSCDIANGQADQCRIMNKDGFKGSWVFAKLCPNCKEKK